MKKREQHGEFSGYVKSRGQVPGVNCRTLQRWIRNVKDGTTKVSNNTMTKLIALGYEM